MSPTRRQTKHNIQKTPIFAPTAGELSSISPKLCMLIEKVVKILKGVNHFSIQRIVFPAGAKMLIFGVPFHMLGMVSSGAIVTLSRRFPDIRLQIS